MSLDGVSTDDPGRRRRRGTRRCFVFFSPSWGDTAWSMYVWRWRLTWCVWDARTVHSVIFFCVSICPSA
jgi:hypothetical protein